MCEIMQLLSFVFAVKSSDLIVILNDNFEKTCFVMYRCICDNINFWFDNNGIN